MRAYLIRHAETNANNERRHQHDHDELSEKGVNQARKLANGLRTLIYDREVRVICADTQRARQTTKIACEELGLTYESSGLLNEVARPSVLHGMDLDAPEARAIKDEIKERVGDPEYRHSDEETFIDVRARVNQLFTEYLAEDQEQNLVFVTHAVFMKAIVARALYGEDYTLEQYNLIYEGIGASDNAAVSQIVFKDGKWWLAYWNNFSHLLEP